MKRILVSVFEGCDLESTKNQIKNMESVFCVEILSDDELVVKISEEQKRAPDDFDID